MQDCYKQFKKCDKQLINAETYIQVQRSLSTVLCGCIAHKRSSLAHPSALANASQPAAAGASM